MPATRTIANREADALMTALVTLKPRLSEGMTYLATHAGDAARFEDGQRRLLRIAVREYLPALRELAGASDRRELHRRRMTLKRRLQRGWVAPESERANLLFTELLLQYEILSDALCIDHPSPARRPLRALQERMRRIELAAVRPEPCDSDSHAETVRQTPSDSSHADGGR